MPWTNACRQLAKNWSAKPQKNKPTRVQHLQGAKRHLGDEEGATDGGRWKNRVFLHRKVYHSTEGDNLRARSVTLSTQPFNSKSLPSSPGPSTVTRSCIPVAELAGALT